MEGKVSFVGKKLSKINSHNKHLPVVNFTNKEWMGKLGFIYVK